MQLYSNLVRLIRCEWVSEWVRIVEVAWWLWGPRWLWGLWGAGSQLRAGWWAERKDLRVGVSGVSGVCEIWSGKERGIWARTRKGSTEGRPGDRAMGRQKRRQSGAAICKRGCCWKEGTAEGHSAVETPLFLSHAAVWPVFLPVEWKSWLWNCGCMALQGSLVAWPHVTLWSLMGHVRLNGHRTHRSAPQDTSRHQWPPVATIAAHSRPRPRTHQEQDNFNNLNNVTSPRIT